MARPISSYSIEASSIDSAAPTESRASAVAPLAAADSDASSDDENGSIVVSDLEAVADGTKPGHSPHHYYMSLHP